MRPGYKGDGILGQWVRGEVILNRRVAGNYYKLAALLPSIARVATPGQFIQVKCGPGPWPLLRRPFSLYQVDREWGLVTLIYQVQGVGTTALSAIAPGQELDVIGPLGRAFPVVPGLGEIWLVAGGVGIAPLFFLAREAQAAGKSIRLLLGAACLAALPAMDDLAAAGWPVEVATDDGSAGRPGTVVELLEAALQKERPDALYTCGPSPMLAAVARVGRRYGLPGYASLESTLACGIGACQGCVVTLYPPGRGKVYARVCRDGPVFELEYLLPGTSWKQEGER